MFIVCLLILSGVGLYVTLKPPTELIEKSLTIDIFPELNMDSVQNAFEGASFKKEE
ncbi:hypothetical protein PAECIP111891_06156 [Paenibacillus allorhizoplanae]|uniref:Uncharacterized protein n=1 Tax=Paenibacillus allorhizoplanae TaxID=2905648 RepID=A0ABN8H414_9BACL|nr:hypothetical protein [Paenibacillus allorhizoplanae]CAH1227748.1 hypothetical protein PAECIP111891_06156 [Paenibacillus allorhizoplanae]